MRINHACAALLCAAAAGSALCQAAVPPNPLDALQAEVAEIRKKIDKPPKDAWDKISAVSGLVSGVVVALLGFYATNVYNRRQRQAEERRKDQELVIAQIQTVEKFFSHLTSTEERSRSGALVAIAALGNEELAVKLAKAFAGPGATSALTTLVSTASAPVAAQAGEALRVHLAFLRPRIVRIVSSTPGKGRIATGFFVSGDGLVVTPAHVVDIDRGAALQVGLPDGALLPGKLVATDAARDLALLAVSLPGATVPLGLSEAEPAVGERVTAVFIDDQEKMGVRVGTIIQAEPGPEPGAAIRRIGIDLALRAGASGTPVVDQNGDLVGLVQSTAPDRTVLIPAAQVRAFIAGADA